LDKSGARQNFLQDLFQNLKRLHKNYVQPKKPAFILVYFLALVLPGKFFKEREKLDFGF